MVERRGIDGLEHAGDGLVGADDDVDAGLRRQHVLAGRQALRRVEHADVPGHDADGRVRRDGRVERRLDRDVERDLAERVDVADLARVEVGAGLDRELAHLAADLAGHEDDVGREALDLGVTRRHVLAEDLVDVADRDACGDGVLDGGDEAGPEDGLDEDAVELAGGRPRPGAASSAAPGSLLASKTVISAPPAAAASSAAASMGAS